MKKSWSRKSRGTVPLSFYLPILGHLLPMRTKTVFPHSFSQELKDYIIFPSWPPPHFPPTLALGGGEGGMVGESGRGFMRERPQYEYLVEWSASVLCSSPDSDPVICRAQSRQSAKLFLQSSESGLPHPISCRGVPPFGPVGREGTFACGRGVGGVPIPTRGHTLWCSICII